MTSNGFQAKRVKAAMIDLLYDQPFFAVLALRLQMEEAAVGTACTDGVKLRYDPSYTAQLSNAQLKGLVAHETLHCSNGHCWRRDGRDPKRWNIACDHSINSILKTAGFELPPGGLDDPQYHGLSAEAIYAKLPPDQGGGGDDNDGDGDQPGGNDPGMCGGVADAPSGTGSADTEALQAEWEAATLQAAHAAKQVGKLPAGLERLITEIESPPTRDLVAALLEWAQRAARNDYTWRRPNPRYTAHGLYLPTLYSEEMPPIVACVDTSGSIDEATLNRYVAALQRVLEECKPESMIVISCDAVVHRVAEFDQGDTICGPFPGGGGTDFRPALCRAKEVEPAGIVYLTDLHGVMPTGEAIPECPVLWVVLDESTARPKAPFGETLYI